MWLSTAFQMAPDYDHLTLMEKVEVFEHAVNNTAGDDLAKLLWLKSPSSEVKRSVSIFFVSNREEGGGNLISSLAHLYILSGPWMKYQEGLFIDLITPTCELTSFPPNKIPQTGSPLGKVSIRCTPSKVGLSGFLFFWLLRRIQVYSEMKLFSPKNGLSGLSVLHLEPWLCWISLRDHHIELVSVPCVPDAPHVQVSGKMRPAACQRFLFHFTRILLSCCDPEELLEHRCHFPCRCGLTGGQTTLDPWLWCPWWATSSDWATGELLSKRFEVKKRVRTVTKNTMRQQWWVSVPQTSIQLDVRPAKRQDPSHRLWRLFWGERRFTLSMLKTLFLKNLTPYRFLTGGHDQRKVPWKDPLPAD